MMLPAHGNSSCTTGVLWMVRRDCFLGLYVRGMLPTEHNLSQAAKMISGVLIERLAVV